MPQNSGKPVIKWLELAVSPRWREEGAVALVHPMELGEDQPCYGVTIDRRWLCGSDGALTFFNSTAAATRFLRLLNMDRFAIGESCACEDAELEPFQCFRLEGRGLMICNKCHAGDETRLPVPRDDMQVEDCW